MTRKILLSLLVIGAVLITVAGFTFAVFTDNVASDKQYFDAGTVDIKVNGFDEFFDTTIHMENMEPGDSRPAQPISVYNNGSLPVFYHIWTYIGGEIYNCDPNPACNLQVEFDGPTGGVSPDFALNAGDPDEVPPVPGETESYTLSSNFPLCAGNACQGKEGYVQLFIHAWQQSNLDGYDCVKLEDKTGPPDWLPDAGSSAHGNICYKADGSDLLVVVNGYGLTDNANFQLALDGGDMNDPNDGACTAQDAALAGMASPPDLYESGWWNWGTYLEDECKPDDGGEGVWNYAGVYDDDAVTSDGNGNISYEATLTGLPAGGYIVKANVKEVTGALPGVDWDSVLSGLDYLRFTIPTP